MTKAKFSVVILTLDEEVNLPACLDSVGVCDDVVVFDSFSSDQTKKIAEEKGARFFEREFDNYAGQRNASINDVDYKNEWILIIDADERLDENIFAEINDFIDTKGSDYSMARMRRKDFLFGKWLRRSSGYPTWFGRLIKKGEVRIEREINEEYMTDGKVYHLKNHLIHYPLNKGLFSWFERHNHYSTMEANRLVSEYESLPHKTLFSKDPVKRRKYLKELAFKLPCRPFIVFCYLYLFRLGFLDGLAGLRFAFMRCMYERMIDLKVIELKKK
jgi:glycosyltransferase involved in cell wall biosynthesis